MYEQSSESDESCLTAMCLAEGMAICPWGAVGSGKFQSKTDLEKRAACGEKLRSVTGTSDQTDLEIKVSAGLEKIGKELGTDSVTAVALAYVLQKVPYGSYIHQLLPVSFLFIPTVSLIIRTSIGPQSYP